MKERKGFCHRDVFLFVCLCLGVSEVLGFFLVILWVCSVDPLLLLVCVCVRERGVGGSDESGDRGWGRRRGKKAL